MSRCVYWIESAKGWRGRDNGGGGTRTRSSRQARVSLCTRWHCQTKRRLVARNGGANTCWRVTRCGCVCITTADGYISTPNLVMPNTNWNTTPDRPIPSPAYSQIPPFLPPPPAWTDRILCLLLHPFLASGASGHMNNYSHSVGLTT
jgi:hypothetical protein